MDEINERIQDAYMKSVIGINENKSALKNYLEALDKQYGHPYNMVINMKDFIKHPMFKGLNYKAIQNQAKVLAKKGIIKFDGKDNITAYLNKKYAYESEDIKKEYINEASEVEFKDFDASKQKFITSLVGKGKEKNQNYFSGIHGTIVSLNSMMGDVMRFDAKELKKIASNKDVRWVEIRSIAMGYNIEKKD